MSNEERVLGKIESISFGITGYNDMMLGYSIEFSLDGGGLEEWLHQRVSWITIE